MGCYCRVRSGEQPAPSHPHPCGVGGRGAAPEALGGRRKLTWGLERSARGWWARLCGRREGGRAGRKAYPTRDKASRPHTRCLGFGCLPVRSGAERASAGLRRPRSGFLDPGWGRGRAGAGASLVCMPAFVGKGHRVARSLHPTTFLGYGVQ